MGMVEMKRGNGPFVTLRWVGLVWLAFALRLYRVAEQELRGDEAFGYFLSRRPLPEILAVTLAGEPHPLGSYLVQKVWLALAGSTEIALRFPSIACGLLSIVLLRALLRALKLEDRVAWLSALIMAISPYAVWHSQDARMYMMVTAALLTSTWFFLRALQRPTPVVLATYVAVTFVAFHLHYVTLWVLAAQWAAFLLYAWMNRRRIHTFIPWLGAQVSLGILYLPWIWRVWPTLQAYGGTGDSPPPTEMMWRTFSALLVGETMPLSERRIFAIVGVALALLGTWYLLVPQQRRWAGLLILFLFLFPVGGVWISAQFRPLFNERYFVPASPAFYVLLAAALDGLARPLMIKRGRHMWQRGIILGSVLLLIGFGMGESLYRYFYDPAYDKSAGWRQLAQEIEQWTDVLQPSSVRVVQNYPDPTLWYYYRAPVEHLVLPPRPKDQPGAQREVDRLVASGVVWVVLVEQASDEWDSMGIAARALAMHYTPVAVRQVASWRVSLYARPTENRWRPVDIAFVNGILLEAVEVQPSLNIHPGGPLVVHARWFVPEVEATRDIKMFVHLASVADPRPLAQCDLFFPAQQGRVPISCLIAVPDDLPSGEYRLLVGLYRSDVTGMPRVRAKAGPEAIEVTRLTVQSRP